MSLNKSKSQLQSQSQSQSQSRSRSQLQLQLESMESDYTEKYEVVFRWPMIPKTNETFVSSSEFTLCDSSWSLKIYPIGIHEDGEYLSAFLCSMSKKKVTVTYQISIKNQKTGKTLDWRDPEGIVVFDTTDSNDNEWGNEELILLSDVFDSKNGYIVDNRVVFVVEISVYGREDLAIQSMNKAVEDAVDAEDLISLANQDLTAVSRRLPGGTNQRLLRSQEDVIISSRF